MEAELHQAVIHRDETKVKQILDHNPDIDINWRPHNCWTVLATACFYNIKNIIILLLTHPNIINRIDINCECDYGKTLFWTLCERGNIDGIRLLLNNPRTNLSKRNDDNTSPLRILVYWGHIQVIRWWLVTQIEVIAGDEDSEQNFAQGTFGDFDIIKAPKKILKYRELDLLSLTRHHIEAGWTVPEVVSRLHRNWSLLHKALAQNIAEATRLLELFRLAPELARYQAKLDLKLPAALMAAWFALVIFVSDALLAVKDVNGVDSSSVNDSNGDHKTLLGYCRFFNMASKLPIELQMLLCQHITKADKMIVKSSDAGIAFQHLAVAYYE